MSFKGLVQGINWLSSRAFLSKGIEELEGLVEANSLDESFLKALKKELGYRKSGKRNNRLNAKINTLLASISSNSLEVKFRPGWLSEDIFEEILMKYDFESADCILFVIPIGCKIMVNSAIKLLTFLNQLAQSKNKITLKFVEGKSRTNTLYYLNRMCFFNHLNSGICVVPKLKFGDKNINFGKNLKLVEIISIDSSIEMDENLPSRLAHSIVETAQIKPSFEFSDDIKNKLITAVTTLFSELIDNIREHSGSVLPSFAVCQIYRPSNEEYVAHVAVSDSGMGILETLRPELANNYPDNLEYLSYDDNELVFEMFRTGLSSRNSESGCGLITCARQAMKFDASVRIRIKDNLIKLKSNSQGYEVDTSYNHNSLASIFGTTITFEFPLGSLTK